MSDSKRLSTLRDAIADVDRALLELLRRRMELGAQIGRVKAEAGDPVVVRDAEDRVLSRARQHAEACGVSEEVMEQVFQAIIRGSVERQHRVGIELRRQRGRRVLLLGGAGAIGSWLGQFLPLVGHSVEAADPAWASLPARPGRWSSLADVPDLDGYDFLVVAVPLALTPEAVEEVARRRPRGVVVEVASIKAHVGSALTHARALGVEVSSLHPMFGPGKSPYEPLTFVLACSDAAETERLRIEPLLSHPYTNLVTIPFDHHDRLMGWLLGLAHLTGILFGSALSRSHLDPAELRACASTTFTRQAATAISVLTEDPTLYLDIQRLNPHRQDVYLAAREALDEIVKLVGTADAEGFRTVMAAARRALAGDA